MRKVTWPTRFLAVPVSALTLSREQLCPTPKATPQELARYVAAVPAVHQRLAAGFTESDFQQMRQSPLTSSERVLADTYMHLYSPSGRGSRIEAEFIHGQGLVVTRGRHRTAAAQELGLQFLPVHVRAEDQQTLDRISTQLETEIRRIAPGVVEQQHVLEAAHRSRRDNPASSFSGEHMRSSMNERTHERGR